MIDGMVSLEYLYSEVREEYDGWKYRGVPIFATKHKERLTYVLWYGSKKRVFNSLFDACATIDTFLQLMIWKFQLPAKITIECPICRTKLVGREQIYRHFVASHIEDATETISTLALFEYEYGQILYDVSALDIGSYHSDLRASNIHHIVGQRTISAIDIDREFRTGVDDLDQDKEAEHHVDRQPLRRTSRRTKASDRCDPGLGHEGDDRRAV